MSSVYSGPNIGAVGRMRQVVLRSRARMLAHARAKGFTELTHAHHVVWRYEGAHGRRPTEIAVASGLSKQAVNDLLGQLEGWGYLVRVRDPEDGRGRIVHFTERGHAARRAMREASAAIEDEWRTAIGEPEWSVFRDVLERLALPDDAAKAESPAADTQST